MIAVVKNHGVLYITLFGSTPHEKQFSLIGESLGEGLLHSGCTKMVSGETLMDEYLSTQIWWW